MTYSELMDRFRDRLIVPILDKSGKNVFGFGGRILSPRESSSSSDYDSPKYLNSPESVVFQKKSILFGQSFVEEASQRQKMRSGKVQASGTTALDALAPVDLVVVEGYMDMIALWSIGIESVVATMGTAISKEQLLLATSVATGLKRSNKNQKKAAGGRVVLCMDNDEAGAAAVERICFNGMLNDVTTKRGVAFLVANLPEGIKDPGEFVEEAANGVSIEEAAEKFRQQVIGTAVDWTEWFVQRIIDGFDETVQRGQIGSFGQVFDRIAQFLANTMDAADRTRAAYKIAGKLAELLSKEANGTEASSAVRSQLETDLVETAARIANKNNEMLRRSELNPKAVLASLARGEVPTSDDDHERKLSSKMMQSKRNESRATDAKRSMPEVEDNGFLGSNPITLQKSGRTSSLIFKDFQQEPRKRKLRPKRKLHTETSITPHMSGFLFENDSDAAWLNLKKATVGFVV